MTFQDDRANPAVLTFLRETEVGRVIRLVPPEEEDGEEGGDEGEEGGPSQPLEYILSFPFLLFCIYFPLSYFLRRLGMEEKGKPHYDGRLPHGFIGDCRTGLGNGKSL